MGKNGFVLVLIFMVLFSWFSSAQAEAPAMIISRFVTNALSPLIKWLWSLKSTPKTAISGRSMMKFESGYNVETVFDGSKLGIEPYSVEVLPTGEILVLDSANNNLYKVSLPLARYSRPKLVAGSPEGYSGHVDGKPSDARMSHPKGITVDDRGNIYIADTMNMVIRKISDTGVTTIAGGNWGRGWGHVDGPSEVAKFSTDFDVVYIGSSCSLLVIDRVNQAIREIPLQYDDCASQLGTDFPLGVAVLAAAVFFGFMLALLQRRVYSMLSSPKEPRTPRKANFPPSPYEKPLKPSVRPPLIPTEDELEKQDEGLFGSMWRLVLITGTATAEILGGVFNFKKKVVNHQQHLYYQQKQNHQNNWPLQESFVIPDEDEPPPIDNRAPTPRKMYAFMDKDAEKTYPFRQSRAYYDGWNGDVHLHQQQQQQQQQQLLQQQQQQQLLQQQQQQQQQQHYQQQQQQLQQKHHRHQQQHYPSGPQTFYEQRCETTNEIVFGAVQEQNGRHEAVVIKAVDYGNPMYNHHDIRSRINYMGYSTGY